MSQFARPPQGPNQESQVRSKHRIANLRQEQQNDAAMRNPQLQPGGLRVKKQVSRGANSNAGRRASQDKYGNGNMGGSNQVYAAPKRRLPAQGQQNRARSQNRTTANRGGYNMPPARQQPAAKQSYIHNKENNIQGDVVNYLKDELLATWEAYLIPDYHRTVFLDCIYGLKPQQYSPIIVKEIEDLQNERAPIQNTIKAIIARESCISQIMELEKVLRETDEKNLQLQSLGMQQMNGQNQQSHSQLLDECLSILHSLRMLSLNVVKQIIEWRKQLIYNFLLTNNHQKGAQNIMTNPPQRNNLKKFKNIPFVWENENYLLKMKSDTSVSLYQSHFARYIAFSPKNDPFLVYPSTKHNTAADRAPAQGGGLKGLKSLKGANQQTQRQPRKQLIIPLQNQLMKIIRQCEVYLMEEAVTDQIIKTTQMQIDPVLRQNNEYIPAGPNGGYMQIQSQDENKGSIDENIVDIQTQPIPNDGQRDDTTGATGSVVQDNLIAGVDQNVRGSVGTQDTVATKEEIRIEQNQAEAAPVVADEVETERIEDDDVAMELQGWSLKESEYQANIEAYISRLDQAQRESFAPLARLISSSMQGYDVRVLALTPVGSSDALNASTIRGLVILNQDSAPIKSLSSCGKEVIKMKIILHHISSINPARRAEIMDKALEYINRETHCGAIRVNLFHIKHAGTGQMKADPQIKAILKERKFKWKTVQNDNELGTRSEILEMQNPDSGDAPRVAAREPLSLFFSTMVAFGKEKNIIEEVQPAQIQSQANIVANLMLYKNYTTPEEKIKAGYIPPSCPQEVQQGFIADIFSAIKRNENGSVDENGVKTRGSCVLPGTTAEFEKSSQLGKIKAIRGLSPNKDIEVKLSDKSSSLLASKVNFDCRFKAIDQATLPFGDQQYEFMRIRETQVYQGTSPQFKEILILNSIENDVNFVILIPHQNGQIQVDTMHENIKNGLKNFKETKSYAPGEIQVWLPQFRIGSRSEGNMVSEEQIKNYIVEDGSDPTYVQAYYQQTELELCAKQRSAGNLICDVGRNDIIVTNQEFFVAISLTQLEASGIDLPLCVTRLTQDQWNKH